MNEYDPNKIYKAMVDVGDDWADKKAAFQLLEDMTKTVYSGIFLKEEGTVAEREAKARANSMYEAHLKAIGEARKAYLLAEVKWVSMRALSDARRTEASN